MSTQKAKQDQMDEREDFDYEEAYKSWQEYRVTGKTPRRRGYHASFIYENYLYVHGGHDIREGTLEKMYRINLNPKGNDNEWELIQQRGVEKPGCIGYHTITLHESTAYLFGGSNLGIDNEKMYALDVPRNEWKVIHPNPGEVCPFRDEHSAVLWGDSIVIFAGNVDGVKQNDTWLYHIKENKWEEFKTSEAPPERSNHAC